MRILKRVHQVSALVMLLLVISTSVMAQESELTTGGKEANELLKAYEEINDYAKNNDIQLEMSYETFTAEYKEGQYTSVDDYLKTYYDLLEPQHNTKSSSSSGSGKWYYNTGTSLPQAANYSKYDLIENLQKGDIIYEANGGFGITGHIAIVEGIYYDATHQQYYVRVIEAISDGVVRSVLDDDRVDDKDSSVYRVSGANSTIISKALSFCIKQLGKDYSLDFAKDTSSNESDWYCSELVWAAYINQGIDIETSFWLNEPGITPRDIKNSSNVYSISF